MIVCSCRGISCRQIKEEVVAGARSVKDVASRCRAGRGCGACCRQIRDMIREYQSIQVSAQSACSDGALSDSSAAA